MAYQGRGAWTKVGGTLKYDKVLKRTVPGPYYMVSVNSPMMGLKVHKQLQAGITPDLNEYVVYLATKQIQKRLNAGGANLAVDGMLGPLTDGVIKAFQRANGVADDGVIGPFTAAQLVLPELRRVCQVLNADGDIVAGFVKQESQFDLGAVGYFDSNDIGLGQINGPSHPDLTVEERVDIDVAVEFIATRYKSALGVFDGNIRDAIASYNLGFAGARSWINAGRPDIWTPVGSTVSRNVKAYIDGILGAF